MRGKACLRLLLAVVFLFGLQGAVLATPKSANKLQANSQLVHVYSISGTKGLIDTWERDASGQWLRKMSNIPVVIGYGGVVDAEAKREGDGRTPRGLYALGLAFGYEALDGVNLPYQVMTTNDFWVDDPQSPLYNRLVSGRPAVASYELMRRADEQYRLGIVIEYNTQPAVPYKGSALFLHVWSRQNAVTAGCIAMSLDNMKNLLLWLQAAKQPVIIIE